MHGSFKSWKRLSPKIISNFSGLLLPLMMMRFRAMTCTFLFWVQTCKVFYGLFNWRKYFSIFIFNYKKKKRSYLHFVVLKICIRSSKYRKVKSKNKKSFHEQLNDSLLFLNFYPNFVKVLTLNFLIHDYIIILYVLKCNSLTLEETNPFTLDYNCY